MSRCINILAAVFALWIGFKAQAQVGLTAVGPALTLTYPTAAPNQAVVRGPFRLDAAPDAPPAPGMRRLIVLSHGTAGGTEPDHALAAALARAGFVVAQVLHEGDHYLDSRWAGPESWRRRPLEVMRAIDTLAADPAWSGRLDLSKVGMHGMSAGGVTALSLAGAQWNLLSLVRHCGSHLDDDIGFCLNGALSPEAQRDRRQRFESAREVPDIHLPADLKAWHGGRTPTPGNADPRPDPRIAAVTLAVRVGAIFSAESLARVQVPVGVVTAQHDRLLLPRFHSDWVLAHCAICTRLADVPGGHFDMLQPWPEEVALAVAARQVQGGEVTAGLDPAALSSAHARIVDFYRLHLTPP